MWSSNTSSRVGKSLNGKRFPGCQKESQDHRPHWRWSFLLDPNCIVRYKASQIFMNIKQAVYDMNAPPNFHVVMKTIILCLFLGSLLVLPLSQIDPFIFDIHGFESENSNLYENSEFDEEFFHVGFTLATFSEDASLRSRMNQTNFRSANPAPESPPPEK